MRKQPSNFILLILWKLCRHTENVFLKFYRNCEDILKKSREYLAQICRHSIRKFRDIFASIFGNTCEKL